jgi:hypothetical protein
MTAISPRISPTWKEKVNEIDASTSKVSTTRWAAAGTGFSGNMVMRDHGWLTTAVGSTPVSSVAAG